MMPTPLELKLLTGACILLALWLAWTVRQDATELLLAARLWRHAENSMSLFLMLMMLATSTVQVLARYVMPDDYSMPWTEEAGRLVMVWATLWAAAVLQRTDEHISMSAVFDLLPLAGKRLLLVIGDLVTLGLVTPIAWWGWNNARALDIMTSISLGLPLSIFAYSIPVTSGLMILYSLALLVRRFGDEPIRAGGQPVEI